MPYLAEILTVLAAYLLGSIPTGFLVARVKGIDIRAVGSGNIGATNAMRVLGKPAGIFVLLVDAAKGYLACVFGVLICACLFASGPQGLGNYPAADLSATPSAPLERFAILAGIFAVLGHDYTFWLRFKGGKGVATSAGVYLALAPAALGIAVGVFILAILLTRYVSVASMAAALALSVAVWLLPPHNSLLGVVTTALGAMVILKHRKNIQRLGAGTENRLGKKPQPGEARR